MSSSSTNQKRKSNHSAGDNDRGEFFRDQEEANENDKGCPQDFDTGRLKLYLSRLTNSSKRIRTYQRQIQIKKTKEENKTKYISKKLGTLEASYQQALKEARDAVKEVSDILHHVQEGTRFERSKSHVSRKKADFENAKSQTERPVMIVQPKMTQSQAERPVDCVQSDMTQSQPHLKETSFENDKSQSHVSKKKTDFENAKSQTEKPVMMVEPKKTQSQSHVSKKKADFENAKSQTEKPVMIVEPKKTQSQAERPVDFVKSDMTQSQPHLKETSFENDKSQLHVSKAKTCFDDKKSQTARPVILAQPERTRLKTDIPVMRVQPEKTHTSRDNNTNTADLNDVNTSSKSAEKMSELYANEWTDAFDNLKKSYPDMDIVKLLLHLLKNINDQYERLAQQVCFDKVQSALQLSAEIFKTLVFKDFDSDPLTAYYKKCVEVCWLAAVEDPPMFMNFSAGNKFDTAKFQYYSVCGTYVEFLVWPSLHLYKDGPLLSKGVAQASHVPGPFVSNDAVSRSNLPSPMQSRGLQRCNTI